MFYGCHRDLVNRYRISVRNNHEYVTFVVITIMSFPHSWLIIGFVTRHAPRLEQELLTPADHMSLVPVFSGVRIARALVFCVVFCRSLSFCPFSFGHCMVCPSIYGFWFPLWVSACIMVLILYIGPLCDFNTRATLDISYVVFGVLTCIGLVILHTSPQGF